MIRMPVAACLLEFSPKWLSEPRKASGPRDRLDHETHESDTKGTKVLAHQALDAQRLLAEINQQADTVAAHPEVEQALLDILRQNAAPRLRARKEYFRTCHPELSVLVGGMRLCKKPLSCHSESPMPPRRHMGGQETRQCHPEAGSRDALDEQGRPGRRVRRRGVSW